MLHLSLFFCLFFSFHSSRSCPRRKKQPNNNKWTITRLQVTSIFLFLCFDSSFFVANRCCAFLYVTTIVPAPCILFFFVRCFEERNAIETNPQWQSCMWLCAPVRTTEKRSSIARWSILMAHLIDQYYFICSNEWNMCWRPIHAHGNYVMFAMCCCVVLFVASGYLCKTQNLRQSTAAVSRADDDRATWCRCVDIAVCIHRYSSASVVIASEMGKSDRWLRFARLELILVS